MSDRDARVDCPRVPSLDARSCRRRAFLTDDLPSARPYVLHLCRSSTFAFQVDRVESIVQCVSKRYAAGAAGASALAAYLREVARLPLLSADEERELGVRIQGHRDPLAQTRLIEGNLRFVVSYARRYQGLGVSLIDLIHEGNLGLIEAARRFDPARNVKFITYAVWWIREAIMHVLCDEGRAFSLPRRQMFLLSSRGCDLSLSDAGAGDRGRPLDETLSESLGPGTDDVEDQMIRRANLDGLASALGGLDRKERQVVSLRFGLDDEEPRTLQEIGDRLHLSRERVRQIEARAKEKLRHVMSAVR